MDVEAAGATSREWLRERIGTDDGRLLFVFAPHEVCSVRAAFFLDRWQDMFCPSRDDVLILPATGQGWVLFYCHEDEFEFCKRESPPNQPLQRT